MNLKRPQLKTGDVEVPQFVSDIYWDLRDRRLLPLVALVVVAIAAVPFLLGGDAEEAPAPVAGESAAVEAETEEIDASSLTVVQAKPGLRDYRRRLRRRTPKNPFRQKFTGPGLNGAKLNAQTTTTTSSTGTTSTTTTTGGSTELPAPSSPPATSPPSSAPNSGGGGQGKPKLTFFTFAIDVRITKQGGDDAAKDKKADEPIVKKRVLPQTALPGDKAPVATYMGLGRKGEKTTGKVLLLVSTDVSSVFGETRCVSGGEVCQLIEVEPGFPVTFVYGANEVRYTVNVLKVDTVVTGHS